MDDVGQLLEHLREGFLEEMPVRVQKIENEVMLSENTALYDELYRMLHSLKGTAGSYSYLDITKVAHSMEDVLLALIKRGEFGSRSSIDILLKFIDVLRDTTASLIETGAAPLDIDERLESLRAIIFKENINVLVVEPSKLYASLIEYSLQKLTANFTFKHDGMSALDSLLLNKYDLLITSLECPHLNGDALTAAVRLLHNFNKHIKVILITSREPDQINNKEHFDAILDRKTIKEGKLEKIIATTIKN